MRRTASVSFAFIILTFFLACSSDPDPTEYTVSYRSQVRLPHDQQLLSAEQFRSQVEKIDPIREIRCPVENSEAFQTATDFLGGIEWGHPVSIIKDASFPPLYSHKIKHRGEALAAGMADSAAPTIERPDLVGIQNGIAIFLSKQHGLVAVDVTGKNPVVSCALKLPGDPINFFYKENEIILLVNGKNPSFPKRSALLRFSFSGNHFSFVDSLRFEDQQIADARLFDRVVVVYTSLEKKRVNPNAATALQTRESAVAGMPRYFDPYEKVGVKLQAIKWDSRLSIDWEETFLNDPEEGDPLLGKDPSTLQPGDVVRAEKRFKNFISASDAYLVVTKDIRRTIFDHMEYQTYSICTSYNPQHHQEERCYGKFERRDNPDYVPPNPTTGDYSCNGKKLADCIQEAAPKVSKYIYVKTGQTCEMIWIGQCESYEYKTVSYPAYRNDDQSEFVVYRFVDGSFQRLEETLYELNTPTTGTPASVVFTGKPLALPGLVGNKTQLQFQNGHFYVVTKGNLHTLLIVGNSIAFLNSIPLSFRGSDDDLAVSFSPTRILISDSIISDAYADRRGSQLVTVGLDEPSFPKIMNGFEMPGTNSQLILAESGVLGPGSVGLEYAEVRRNLQKITLFSRSDGSELDNLLLGTEYDTLESSWFPVADDQRIRLHWPSQRLFLPYSGTYHADLTEPIVHRLNITFVDSGRLTSERSFEVAEDIVRTASIDSSKALVFGMSSVYVVDQTTGEWNIQPVREIFVPFATYRLSDKDIYARVDRLGNKCNVLTFKETAAVFGGSPLAQSMIPCNEGELPIGIRNHLVFERTLTGWAISKNGRQISELDKETVKGLLEETQHDDYCALDDTEDYSASVVEFLDEVPENLFCGEVPTHSPDTDPVELN